MPSGEYGEGGEPNGDPNPPKRFRTDQMTEELVPRYLVVKKTDGKDFTSTNPFTITKAVYGLIGEVGQIQKIREGLLIEAKTQKQARKLIQTKKFLNMDVNVVPHKSLNITKGVVTCRDLQNCTEEELCNELKAQGVIEAKRITTRRNGSIQNTASIILTFNREKLPNKILAAMYSLPVRDYIPNPMRCYTCQKFGHTSKNCTKSPICMCGKPTHDGEQCETPMKCVNCDGDHSARSKDCPKFKEELEIIKYKTKNKCSFKEAKDYVLSNSPKFSVSYAQVAAKTLPTSPPSVTEFASALLPQIKKLVEETLTISLTSIIQQVVHAVNQTQAKTTQKTAPTTVRSIPLPEPTNFNYRTPTIVTRATVHQSTQIQTANAKSTNIPEPRNPDNIIDNAASDSSSMSIDGTKVDEARKKIDKRGWQRTRPKK